MHNTPKINSWDRLEIGMSDTLNFNVSQEDMETFIKLSGDVSKIHVDNEFSQKHKFKSPIVYGGITIAKLSHFFGMLLPGSLGLSMGWKIDFNGPLYVGEEA